MELSFLKVIASLSICLFAFQKADRSVSRAVGFPESQRWLLGQISAYNDLIDKPVSIPEIRNGFKEIEVAFFYTESAEKRSRMLELIREIELGENANARNELIAEVEVLHKLLSLAPYTDHQAAMIASLVNIYAVTLPGWKPGWKTAPALEDRVAEAQAELHTLIRINELNDFAEKPLIEKGLLKFSSTLAESSNTGIFWKDIYLNHIRSLINLLSAESDLQNYSTIFKPKNRSGSSFVQEKNKYEIVALGELLFFEPALSSNNRRSCSSCHRPEKSFCDNRITSLGFDIGTELTRNSPTLLNIAYETSFFHDGRAESISAVIKSVIEHPDEFRNDFPTILRRLSSSSAYAQKFKGAFGEDKITEDQVTTALTQYVVSLTQWSSKFDEWIEDERNINLSLSEGYNIFVENCSFCHFSGSFSGLIPPFYTQNEKAGEVKTPGLRNVEKTQPYFHNGSVLTLTNALRNHYTGKLSPENVQDLTTFLNSLTDQSENLNEPKELPSIPDNTYRTVGGYY